MKRKGFTLIELLAVIVILAVIAIIATPLIMNVINDARKNSFKDSAYGITKAIELKSMRERLNDNGNSTFVVDLTGTDLDYKGSKPKAGYAAINVSGDIALEMNDGTWCVTKGFTDTDVTITKLEEGCDGSSIQSLNLSAPTSSSENANTEQIEEWCIVGTVEGQPFNSCDDDSSFSTETECKEEIQRGIEEGFVQEGDVTCQKEVHAIRYEKELSTLNSNVYFKHAYKDNNPYTSYVCLMADKEYCFRGMESAEHYNQNVEVLESLQSWIETNGGSCTREVRTQAAATPLSKNSNSNFLLNISGSFSILPQYDLARGEKTYYTYICNVENANLNITIDRSYSVSIAVEEPNSCDGITVEENYVCRKTTETLTVVRNTPSKELVPAHTESTIEEMD